MRYKVDGKYPIMANWLMVKRPQNGIYQIKNILTDEWYAMNETVYGFLKELDGNTNPERLGEKWEVDYEQLMDEFEENQLIRTEKRKMISGFGMIYLTLLIPRRKTSKSIFPKAFNLLLQVGWCPMLIGGIYYFIHHLEDVLMDHMILGYGLSLILGICFHEFAHAIACLAYGGYFFEAGIMWQYFFPGAYVLIDKSRIKSKLHRIQVMAAGVEANLLLAGLFLFFTPMGGEFSGCFLTIAINNVTLAIINLTFTLGLDGSAILGEILGLQERILDITDILKESILGRNRMEEHNRVALMITCVVVIGYQLLLPIAIINNILVIIGG